MRLQQLGVLGSDDDMAQTWVLFEEFFGQRLVVKTTSLAIDQIRFGLGMLAEVANLSVTMGR